MCLLKKIITTLFALSLIISSLSLVSFSQNSIYEKNNLNDIKLQIEDSIKGILYDGFSEFYHVNGFQFRFDDFTYDGTKVTADVSVTMNKTLKAEKPEDLPYIKGMLKKLNLDELPYRSETKIAKVIAEFNKDIKVDKNDRVVREIRTKFNDLDEYINQPFDNNFHLKISANTKSGLVLKEELVILAENVDSLTSITNVLPQSSDKMELNGYSDMQMLLEMNDRNYLTRLYPGYDRIAARDYAREYTSDPANCDVHGWSCGMKQDRSKWNLSSYPYYSALLHNDCANFVSQSLHAGGIPTDSQWRYYRMEWANTADLKNYMKNIKGYWIPSTFSLAAAGGVLYTSSSHVVLIVRNDTVVREFCAHTNDRWNENYSNNPNFEYYVLW